MATPSDLTQSGPALIFGLINTANPSLPNGPLSATNATLGVPAVSGTTPNTSLLVSAVANQGYSGSVTVQYNRLNIQTDVMTVKAPGGATLVNNSFAQVSDLLAPLNSAYGLDLQPSDISNGSTAIALTNGAGSATLDIAPGSLVYTGTLNVTISQEQLPLANVITVTSLSGLTAPAAPTPSPAPSPAPAAPSPAPTAPTPSPAPSPTPTAPTPSPAPSPAPTPSPTPSPTPTAPTPSPTPTP